MITVVHTSASVLAAMKAAPSHQKAWEILIENDVNGQVPSMIGGLDHAEMTEKTYTFYDRGVSGKGHRNIKVKVQP